MRAAVGREIRVRCRLWSCEGVAKADGLLYWMSRSSKARRVEIMRSCIDGLEACAWIRAVNHCWSSHVHHP